MRDCFFASFLTAQIGSAHQASVWARLMEERERVLVYLTTHGYVRRVLGPPTAAYAAGVVGE